MHKLLKELSENVIKDNNMLEESVRILEKYEKHIVAEHVKQVGLKAKELAIVFGVDENKAEIAGFFHDISAVIPNNKKIEVAESLNMKIFNEERELPNLIHQRLSKEIANLMFAVKDKEILDAISCHTTLKANPTKLDMVVFIADKIMWDQSGTPPYIKEVKEGLDESLEQGVHVFINYLYKTVNIIHPLLEDAHVFFNKKQSKF